MGLCIAILPLIRCSRGGHPVAKLVLIKTTPNDTYINPDHVVCIEAVGTGCRITMTDGRDFTTPEDKDSVAMHLSELVSGKQ
jgi:hypothetical protein